MIVLLGSKNPTKHKSLQLALDELNVKGYEIFSYDVSSGVDSLPIGYEIIRGAENRNQELKRLAIEKNIDFDYVCSIEGGYSIDESGSPFVVTYCIVEDKNGKKYTGKSLGLSLSWQMFEYISNGYSLNTAIEEITNTSNNKQNDGLTGYLTNNFYKREAMDKDAVVSAFVPFIFKTQKDALDEYVKKVLKR